jgi:hypothetical protein
MFRFSQIRSQQSFQFGISDWPCVARRPRRTQGDNNAHQRFAEENPARQR